MNETFWVAFNYCGVVETGALFAMFLVQVSKFFVFLGQWRQSIGV